MKIYHPQSLKLSKLSITLLHIKTTHKSETTQNFKMSQYHTQGPNTLLTTLHTEIMILVALLIRLEYFRVLFQMTDEGKG